MIKSDRYISASKVQEQFGISSSSLRRWDGDGKIQTIRTPGGFRLYRFNDIQKLFSQKDSGEEESQKAKICYARVSSDHQKEDLERQINDLKTKYPDYEIIKDIGSGLNYKRRGFSSLLERVYEGTVSEVVITHKDRLCRYGFELVEFVFKKTGTKLVVLGQSTENQDSTRELAGDLLAICNYFVAKNNGMRSAENRRKRKAEEKNQDQRQEVRKETGRKIKKNKTVSNAETEGNIDEVVRNSEMDL